MKSWVQKHLASKRLRQSQQIPAAELALPHQGTARGRGRTNPWWGADLGDIPQNPACLQRGKSDFNTALSTACPWRGGNVAGNVARSGKARQALVHPCMPRPGAAGCPVALGTLLPPGSAAGSKQRAGTRLDTLFPLCGGSGRCQAAPWENPCSKWPGQQQRKGTGRFICCFPRLTPFPNPLLS